MNPTQVQYPWRAAVRTALAYIVGAGIVGGGLRHPSRLPGGPAGHRVEASGSAVTKSINSSTRPSRAGSRSR